MTGAEALEAVAAGICGTDPCHYRCSICREDAERALKALNLSWDQAAALMSGEARVLPVKPTENQLDDGILAANKGTEHEGYLNGRRGIERAYYAMSEPTIFTPRIDELLKETDPPSPASEKETP